MRKSYITHELISWLNDTTPWYQWVIRKPNGKLICAYDDEQDAIDYATKAGYGDVWEHQRPVLVQKFD